MWTSWAGTSHYHQYRITQQYCSKNDYDREKWENMAILIVKYLHLKKKLPIIPLGNNYYARNNNPTDSY